MTGITVVCVSAGGAGNPEFDRGSTVRPERGAGQMQGG